jgi:thioester reductase-like protein
MHDTRTQALYARLAALTTDKQVMLLQKLRSQGFAVPMRVEHGNDVLTGEPDLRLEAYLEPSIKPSAPWTFTATPRNIFLSGATGFLGAFLLTQLLERSDVTVWCLVRAPSDAAALERVLNNLRKYGLPTEHAQARVRAVCGDLASPLMGMHPDMFQRMAETCEVVYHNGALMNFMYGYDAFIGANVVGTQETLRLACTGIPKGFHTVSTMLMFMLARHDLAGTSLVDEKDSEERGRFALGGYAQSKWVSENLVVQARHRGLTATTYRCAMIIGDTHTGAYDPKEAWGRIIKSAVVEQLALDKAVPMYAIAVDKAARMLAALAAHPDARNRTFHLAEPEPMGLLPWNELRDAGYPVRVMDNAHFYGHLSDDVKEGRKTALASLESFLNAAWPGGIGKTFDILAHMPRIKTEDARTLLGERADTAAINVTVSSSIRRMMEDGWIPPPPRD